MDVYQNELTKRRKAESYIEKVLWLVLAVILIAGTYQVFYEVSEEPERTVTCDGSCYWITMDDGTRCRVFIGKYLPNRDWPMLCEVEGKTVPYQDWIVYRDELAASGK